jgi:hypothetical protein
MPASVSLQRSVHSITTHDGAWRLVERVVGQEPLADVLKLLALNAVIGVEAA